MLWREYLVSDWKTEKWEFWLHLKEGVPMALTFRLKLWLDLYLYFWPLSIIEWMVYISREKELDPCNQEDNNTYVQMSLSR